MGVVLPAPTDNASKLPRKPGDPPPKPTWLTLSPKEEQSVTAGREDLPPVASLGRLPSGE